MSADETIPLDEAVKSVEYLGRQLAEMKRERDQYRDWFERLFAAAWQGDGELHDELERVRAEHDRVVNARTRRNVAKGEDTVRKVIEARDAGKSIAATARDLGISQSRVAHIRSNANKKAAL